MMIEELLKQPEGKTLEFKENTDSSKNILATLIAFANTAGGKLVLGIEDTHHHIIGIDSPHLAEQRLASLISESIVPTLVPSIEIIGWKDIHIMVVEVYPSALRPHYMKCKGLETSTYVRVGSTNRLADAELIGSMRRSLNAKSFDEELCPEASSEEIDFRVVSELFLPYRALKIGDLETLGLLVKAGKHLTPSVGGILLFSPMKDRCFPDAWIQAGRFAGLDKTQLIDSQEIKMPLALAIEPAIQFIHKHIFTRYEIGAIRREEIWSIPQTAIREALINAVTHADYALSGAPIRISIFADRIEIENPGLLPFGMTIEDIMSGISKIRNRVIARVFHELRLIEKWGSGIQRIMALCKEAGLRLAQFREIGARFRVTLYNTRISAVMLDSKEEQIMTLLRKQNTLATREIALAMNLSTRSIRSILLRMLEKGMVIEIGRSPTDPSKKYALKASC